MERVLLKTVKFDLQLDHPYSYLLKFGKVIKGVVADPLELVTIDKLFETAWTFINDSYSTTLCLQTEPDVIGLAVLYLATRIKS